MFARLIMMSMLALVVTQVRALRAGVSLQEADVDAHMETPALLQARIVNDEASYCKTAGPKFCEGSRLKTLRPVSGLHVSSAYLLDNLYHVEDMSKKDTFLFRGELSGWPAFTDLALEAIRCNTLAFHEMSWISVWNKNGRKGQIFDASVLSDSDLADSGCIRPFFVQGLFSQQHWVAKGWSAKSPGFAFWFRGPARGLWPGRDQTPSLMNGHDIVDADKDGGMAVLTSASLVTHRYYAKHETWKDKRTYHAAVLLEWSHEAYTTVVELAWRNTVGATKGRVNWYDDGHTIPTALYKEMEKTPHMIQPWDASKSEIRIYDVPAKNASEWRHYLEKYDAAGPRPEQSPRFIDAHVKVFPAKPQGRSRTEIHAALLRYIEKADGYVELISLRGLASNCQTFAADFLKWLTGEETRVATPMVGAVYVPRDDYFNES